MTGKLDPEERVLDGLLIQELESGPIEVGPGHFTHGYGSYAKHPRAPKRAPLDLQQLKEHGDKHNYDTYSK